MSTTASAKVIGGPNTTARALAKRPAPVADPSTLAAGATTVVSGTQCSPDLGPTNVFVSLVDPSGNVIGSGSELPQPDGTWQVPLTVPSRVKAGKYQIDSTCDSYYSEFYYPTVPLAVTAAPASPWSIQGTVSTRGPDGSVSAVSCETASSCVAVGTHLNSSGLDVPFAQVWNDTNWVSSTLPVPKGGESYGAGDVSCSAATTCVAVGNYVQASGRQVTLAWIWNGAKWVINSPVNPIGGSTDVLSSVSCPKVDWCTAVGSYKTDVGNEFETLGLVEAWNGTTWSIQSIAAPSGTGPSAYALSSVSCVSASNCTAVGWDGPYNEYYGALQMVARWNGVVWSSASLPSSSDSYLETLSSVSCSSATTCIGVGLNQTYSGDVPLVEALNGTTWTSESAATVTDGTINFAAVSCPSTNSCTAVGSEEDYSTGTEIPLAEVRNAGTWSIEAVPAPKRSGQASLTAVSCPVSNSCWATGGSSEGPEYSDVPTLPFAVTFGAGSWTLGSLLAVTGETTNSLQSISCSAPTTCEAVGTAQNSSGNSIPQAEKWNGTAWAAQSVTAPSGSRGAWVTQVSCAGANACIAIGGFENKTYQTAALSWKWDGTSWTTVTVPTPTDAYYFRLNSVSCTGIDTCVAIGTYTASNTYDDVLLSESWNGAIWTESTISTLSVDSYAQLTSISCSASNACVAVGGYETYSPYYASGPLVETWNGLSWSETEITNVGLQSTLDSVNCVDSTHCTAVGTQYGSDGSAPLAEVLSDGTWTAQTPGSGGNGAELNSISCVSASSCTAVGWAWDFAYPNEVPIVETWDGTNWTLPAMPTLPDAATGSLSSVSCISSGVCGAVGTMNPGDVLAVGEGGA
jgi:hypothetical protein